MRNSDVARAWQEGRRATSGHMHTDGDKIYSYNLCIGESRPPCEKVSFNYTAHRARRFPGRDSQGVAPHYVSRTTSHHQELVAQYADYVADNPVIRGR